ncbi:methyltransferase [Mycolicibacterium litorale]|nr:methyltransferase [Mycolicibacterium litorale]
MANSPNHYPDVFDDPQFVELYADRVAQMMPMVRDLHRMVTILLAEHAPDDARILVLGAGGGLETRSLAEAAPGWTFDAVDPSKPMLELAARTLEPHAPRVVMHHGYIDDAPSGPFAGATSLFTLHFLPEDERRRTVAEVRRRLAPGAPFVVAHLSFPHADDAERELWLRRHVATLLASGNAPADVDKARNAIATEVPVLSPERDRAVLQEAGFTDVTEFFSAFTLHGWVGYA